MAKRNQTFGARAEALSALTAERKGYQVLARNQRTPFGEIDIILRSPEGMLVFMEVKARAGDSRGTPEDAITSAKLRRMGDAAFHWTESRYERIPPCRLDVMALRYSEDQSTLLDLKWYEDVG